MLHLPRSQNVLVQSILKSRMFTYISHKHPTTMTFPRRSLSGRHGGALASLKETLGQTSDICRDSHTSSRREKWPSGNSNVGPFIRWTTASGSNKQWQKGEICYILALGMQFAFIVVFLHTPLLHFPSQMNIKPLLFFLSHYIYVNYLKYFGVRWSREKRGGPMLRCTFSLIPQFYLRCDGVTVLFYSVHLMGDLQTAHQTIILWPYSQ